MCFTCRRYTVFFPSAADKAQRLGPESWINVNNSNKDKHNVQAVQKSVAVAINRPNEKKRQTRTTRKSPSQICVSPQQRNSKTTADRGQSPNKKKHNATKAEREKPPYFLSTKTAVPPNFKRLASTQNIEHTHKINLRMPPHRTSDTKLLTHSY
jgi:hypothetical protein